MRQISVSFYTLGCKLNFSESAALGKLTASSGFNVLAPESSADIAVINTCSVTAHADASCRKMVRDIRAINEATSVVVIGCYAQLKPQEIASIEGVKLVLGAAEKFDLPNRLTELVYDEIKPASDKLQMAGFGLKGLPYHAAWSTEERTRSFLKVQDGCDYSCSFCTIPWARGGSRNATVRSLVDQARAIATDGTLEIVITGVNTGDFGKTTGESFFSLVQALDNVREMPRFRISSIEPNLLTDEIISFVAGSERFVSHFHIPLQSGSNRILAAMRRRYRKDAFLERIVEIKRKMPNCCIGVDVIAGFPGETQEDFDETYQFLSNLPIGYLHVFPYSPRPGTLAVNLNGHIGSTVRSERAKILRSLSNNKRLEFYESQQGAKAEVLFERGQKNGLSVGFTRNYVKVSTPWVPSYSKSLINCTLGPLNEHGMVSMLS